MAWNAVTFNIKEVSCAARMLQNFRKIGHWYSLDTLRFRPEALKCLYENFVFFHKLTAK